MQLRLRHPYLLLWVFCMLAGCGATRPAATTSSVATETPIATMTPLPTVTLHWQALTVPPGNKGFAASDGNTIYGCEQNQATTTAQLWITHSGGMHFSYQAIPSVTNGSCDVVVDDYQPTMAVVKIEHEQYPAPNLASDGQAVPFSAPGANEIADYITYDSGQTWQLIPNHIIIDELATVGTATYALIGTTQSPQPELAVTHDHMATWQRLHPPNDLVEARKAQSSLHDPLDMHLPFATFADPRQIWVNPAIGTDLLFFDDVPPTGQTLAYTTNGGQTWESVSLPPELQEVVVQSPPSGHIWHMCGDVGNNIQCSHDAGQTWASLPMLPGSEAMPYLDGISASGDVIATNNSDATIYRLTSGASQWQSLGVTPGGATYCAAPTPTGVLQVGFGGGMTPFPKPSPYLAVYP